MFRKVAEKTEHAMEFISATCFCLFVVYSKIISCRKIEKTGKILYHYLNHGGRRESDNEGFLRRCFLIFMVMLLAGGCARQKETESVTKESDGQEKVMRYVNYSMFSGEGLNHLKLKGSAEQTISCYLLEGLMRVYQYELQYGMADRYEISEDQKVYTFYLRDDACYSDGTPVTADDFLGAFQKLVEPEYFNSYAAIIKNAEDIYQGKKRIEELGVTVLNEKTLQIELEHPQVQFLQLLALRSFVPIRKDATEILRPEDCNGPFTLDTWSGETGKYGKRIPITGNGTTSGWIGWKRYAWSQWMKHMKGL